MRSGSKKELIVGTVEGRRFNFLLTFLGFGFSIFYRQIFEILPKHHGSLRELIYRTLI